MDFHDFKEQVVKPLAKQFQEQIDIELSKKHPPELRMFEQKEPIDNLVAISATHSYLNDVTKKFVWSRRLISRPCEYPFKECENKNGRKNHIFSVQKVLKNFLADKGDVYALNANVTNRTRGQFDFQKVGVNKTAYFRIFCGNCDGKLFALIDNKLPLEDFDTNDKEAFVEWLNLLQYRGFCAAFDFMIDRSVKTEMLVNLEKEHANNGVPEFFNKILSEVTMKKLRLWFNYAHNFWEWKKDFDVYLKKMPDKIVHIIRFLNVNAPSIAGSVGCG